jgi:hypothetical protein
VLYSARDDHRGVITIINFCLEREILNEKGSFRNETVGHMPSIGALLSQVDKGTSIAFVAVESQPWAGIDLLTSVIIIFGPRCYS